MQKFKKVSIKLLPALIIFVLLPVVVFAQLPTVTPTAPPGLTLTELEALIKKVTQFLTVIGVLVATAFIVWGAMTKLTAGGDEKKAEVANNRIRGAIWAALIILAVGLIIQTLTGVVTRTFFQ